MTYNQAVELIFEQLPAYSKVGRTAIKSGLYNIDRLCAYLDDPQKKFSSIHVAGTNGKGSTCHILSAIFTHCGYKTGLYTSPHLNDIRERCRIDGQMVSEAIFTEFVEKIQPVLNHILPSYFELNVALAFYAFARENVDIAIIETGLGGRMDSTNIILPELSVITHIALDHTDILGDTLEKIAREKAGIIKSRTPVVIGKTQDETKKVFVDTALSKGSNIVFADEIFTLVKTHSTKDIPALYKCVQHNENKIWTVGTDLQGDFQMYNIATAFTAIQAMQAKGWNVDISRSIEALAKVKPLSGLKGRWDFFRKNIILDVAHNPDGIHQVVDNLHHLKGNLKFIFGAAKDKDVLQSVKLLPKDALYFITQARVPRAKPVSELETIFQQQDLQYQSFPTVSECVQEAYDHLQDEDLLIIIGSFFIVGEAYDWLEKHALP